MSPSPSADPSVAGAVAAYCRNPFDPGKLPPPPVFPLADEPHLADWRRYARRGGRAPFLFLRGIFPQLRVPIRAGISERPEYRRALRGDGPVAPAGGGGGLRLRHPGRLGLRIHPHFAGCLPVLETSDRSDFEALGRALGHRSEPVAVPPGVNALTISGFLNRDRVVRYRAAWARGRSGREAAERWPEEMARADREEPSRFRDRFLLLHRGPYSGVGPERLGLDLSAERWLDVSDLLRLEHEFTHYATKRLYGVMRNNLLDETIADCLGMTAALGRYRKDWGLAFLGLDRWPRIAAAGRARAYRGELGTEAFRRVCRRAVEAAAALERIAARFYRPDERGRFLLALTFAGLLQPSGGDPAEAFAGWYEKAGRLCGGSPQNRPAGGKEARIADGPPSPP